MQIKALPLELWSLVATLAARSDLGSLALVAMLHLSATRPILYKRAKIQVSEIPSHSAPLELLRKNNWSLARKIERLTLVTEAIVKAGTLLDIIVKMTNLQQLVIEDRCDLLDEAVVESFSSFVNTHCLRLQEVEVLISRGNLSQTPLHLSGLQKVKLWSPKSHPYSYNFSAQALLSLLTTSAATLTHLILPSTISEQDLEDIIPFSRTVVLPSLTTLILGVWVKADSPEIADALVIFLYAHPTIETLHLGWDSLTEYRIHFPQRMVIPSHIHMAALGGLFDAKLLLPNLQSLSAHALTITEIATLFPDTLSRLIELSFGVGAEDHARDSLVDMVLALRKIDGLPLLKKLRHIEGESMKDDLDGFIEVMEGMGAVVTGLNIWESDMPEGLNLKLLVGLFSKISDVRAIKVHSSWVLSSTLRVDTARALGSHCPRLELFSLTPKDATSGGYSDIVRIHRGPGGEIWTTSSVREIEADESW